MYHRATIENLFRAKADCLHFPVGKALINLNTFMAAAEACGFTRACRHVLGSDRHSNHPVDVVARVAKWATEGLPEVSQGVFGKALQETLLEVCGIERDSDCGDPDRSMWNFLSTQTYIGVFELCLSLYVYHTLALGIEDEVRRVCENDGQYVHAMSLVRELSQAAVAHVLMAEWEKMLPSVSVSEAAGKSMMERIRQRVLAPSAFVSRAGG